MSNSAETCEPVTRMSRHEYRLWTAQQPRGRFERINGIVVARDGATAMSPERASHNLAKLNIRDALRHAIRRVGLPCQAFGDGMTVEVDDSDYEPDAVVRCGETRLPPDAIAVPDPLIIVEVLSPATSGTDRAWKLPEYFKLPAVRHYLIVWPEKQQIAHHRRGAEGAIETRIVMNGDVTLDPPGITFAIEEVYAP